MAKVLPIPSLDQPRPVLDLSGPKLRDAFERLVKGAEPVGGVERFAAAVKLKSDVFRDRLADGRSAAITRGEFQEIVPLMATVRRRIGPLLDQFEWPVVRSAIAALLANAHDTTIADSRISAFESALSSAPMHRPARPADDLDEWQQQAESAVAVPLSAPLGAEPGRGKRRRFLRDLASEVLHNVLPEHYPLMNRWVWDARTNTGALREIWHDTGGSGDNVDRIIIDAPDGYQTFLVLREELSQFLSENGVFRDMLWHVDLLLAQVYGDYVNSQGGAYLKTDFSAQTDPLEHTRRIIGLDRISRGKRGTLGAEWSVVSAALTADEPSPGSAEMPPALDSAALETISEHSPGAPGSPLGRSAGPAKE